MLEAVDQAMFNKNAGRTDTIRHVAAGLLRATPANESSLTKRLHASDRRLEYAHEAGPYVGAVSGIGPALMGYLRLLGRADTIKSDELVISRLKVLGFDLGDKNSPDPRHALMTAVLAGQADRQ